LSALNGLDGFVQAIWFFSKRAVLRRGLAGGFSIRVAADCFYTAQGSVIASTGSFTTNSFAV
jgi:hypothetical protein